MRARECDPALAPGVPAALGLLGAGPEAAETMTRRSRTMQRRNALEWATGLKTESGRDRGLAIATCGRPAPALCGQNAGVVQLRCRDRACPACQSARGNELAEQISLLRDRFEGRWVFVTLTQRKRPSSEVTAEQAVDSLMACWRSTFNLKYRAGREVQALCEGGVRAIEVTARAPGSRNPDGTSVKFFGWHVHMHALVRLRPGVTREAFEEVVVRRWLETADAASRSQCIVPATEAASRYLAKYVAKPLGQKIGRHHGRALFAALHGRRMMEGFGCFRSWKRLAPKPLRDALLVGVQSLAQLAAERRPVKFAGWERVRPVPSSRGPEWERNHIVFEVAADVVIDVLRRGRQEIWRPALPPTGPPAFVWRAGVQ